MKRSISVFLVLFLLFNICPYSPAAAAGNDNYTVLQQGDSGQLVKELQTRLVALGYSTNGIDGNYGEGTVSAVIKFQSKNGLEITGVADAKTQALIYQSSGKNTSVGSTGTGQNQFIMQATPRSTCFSEVGYNASARKLRVCVRTTGYYQYSNFSQADYDKFIAADSLGSYYNQYIKGKYPCERETSYQLIQPYSSHDYYDEIYDELREEYRERHEIDTSDLYDWFSDRSYDYDIDEDMDREEYFESHIDSIRDDFYDVFEPDPDDIYEWADDYYDW